MTEKEKQTEEKIANAAQEVFVEKGMSGARMQEIADRAGINKSLLHYYFRSKEKLFDFVFSKIAKKIGHAVFTSMGKEETSIENRIECFVEEYLNILMKNPFLPLFIISEMNRNPEKLANRFRSANIDPVELTTPLAEELNKAGYSIEPTVFMINLLSLCIFPFIARPVIEQIIFSGDKNQYKAFLKERKEHVVKFMLAGLEAYRTH
jgi:AcrR family transcriptional regulator